MWIIKERTHFFLDYFSQINFKIRKVDIMKDEANNKESRLLEHAFKLFTEKGVKDTSIQEITNILFIFQRQIWN